jgi:hypothetical protein
MTRRRTAAAVAPASLLGAVTGRIAVGLGAPGPTTPSPSRILTVGTGVEEMPPPGTTWSGAIGT